RLAHAQHCAEKQTNENAAWVKIKRRMSWPIRRRPILIVLIIGALWPVCYYLNLLARSPNAFQYPPDMNLFKIYDLVRTKDNSKLPPRTMPKFRALLYDRHVCKDSPVPKLLFLVKSIHSNFAQREQIRNSWGNPMCAKSTGVISRTVFLLGQLKDRNASREASELQRKLELEQKKYHDIVQFNFVDSYANNTYKILSAMEFASSECPMARFVAILDDDFLVHPVNLIKTINQVTDFQYPIYIAGDVISAGEPRRSPFSKWYVPYRVYPFYIYPDYPTGGTIIISMPMVKLLSTVMPYTAYLYIDDVLLGIILHKLGINPVHLDGIHLFSKPAFLIEQNFISAHGYNSPEKLRQGWSLLNLQFECEQR
ncbi:UDP-glcNAc:betaGal beta-1,3-N-acetylglucosaminyltransferase 5, partial [Clonorchis sinensis]